MDEDISELLEEQGISKESLEAALELARLVGEDTGICCEDLGLFAWMCYRRLEGDNERN
jgi:hypothetical protein